MIVCWTLFTISLLVSAIGGFGYKYYSDKMLDLRTEQMIVDGVTGAHAIKGRLRKRILNLEDKRKMLSRLALAGMTKNDTTEKRHSISAELTIIQSRYSKAMVEFERAEPFGIVGIAGGLIAAVLLLWNILLYTVAWVIAGRKKDA